MLSSSNHCACLLLRTAREAKQCTHCPRVQVAPQHKLISDCAVYTYDTHTQCACLPRYCTPTVAVLHLCPLALRPPLHLQNTLVTCVHARARAHLGPNHPPVSSLSRRCACAELPQHLWFVVQVYFRDASELLRASGVFVAVLSFATVTSGALVAFSHVHPRIEADCVMTTTKYKEGCKRLCCKHLLARC